MLSSLTCMSDQSLKGKLRIWMKKPAKRPSMHVRGENMTSSVMTLSVIFHPMHHLVKSGVTLAMSTLASKAATCSS
jgi:hypothetical protein